MTRGSPTSIIKIGDLLEEPERLGIRDETAIIVGGDHGEW